MSMAAKGIVPLDAALAFVLGANLGTAINPILEGASGSDPASRRVPVGNFLIRGFGVLLALGLLPPMSRWIVAIEPDSARAVANFHLLFNLLLAAIFFPLLGPIREVAVLVDVAQAVSIRLTRRVPLPRPISARETPIVALGGASREALRLVDVLDEMLKGARNGPFRR